MINLNRSTEPDIFHDLSDYLPILPFLVELSDQAKAVLTHNQYGVIFLNHFITISNEI